MARPQKGTIDYFPHYISGGKTLFILENDFGNDGYAFWFKLLEVLGGTDGMFFDWGNSSDRRFLLSKTKVNEEKALAIIETLLDVGAIDRELWEQRRIIWVQNLVDNVADAFKKRVTAMPKKPFSVPDEPPEQLLIPVDDTKEETDQEPPTPTSFDEFWSVYPKKASRADAESAWKAIVKAKAPLDQVIAAARNYAEQCKGKELQFVKHPATFLRKERWKDHLEAPSQTEGSKQPSQIDRMQAAQDWIEQGGDPYEFDE